MIKDVWQCCYTNAIREVGNIVSSGWQAVCVSPELPSEALAFCTKIQSANSSIQRNMVDESGAVLNLLELSGDGSYIYVMRTQYGLRDRLGRANMFSHAYIFSCKDADTVSDPNLILTIANDNFKDNEVSAMEEVKALSRIPAFEIRRAMQVAGLDKATYFTLIRSVYTQMSDKKSIKPLYIQYDGTEDALRAILFCIYYGLPFSLRRRLSVASVKTDNTVGKNIIFSRKAREQDVYIDLVTGENTVLTPRIERRLSRLGFLDFAAGHVFSPNIQQYFEELENKAFELGDASGTNELILRFAHYQLAEEGLGDIEDIELDARLSDALRSRSIGNKAMDEYIALLLREITSRKLVLTDENEKALMEKLATSPSNNFPDAVEQYNLYRLNDLPMNEAAIKLSQMPEPIFSDYRAKLLSQENGRKLLDYYYAEIMLNKSHISWESIQKVVSVTADLTEKRRTDNRIDEYAWKLYCDSFDMIKEGRISYIVSEYNKYMSIMRTRLSKDDALQCALAAKEVFWDYMTYDDINFVMYHHYKEMEVHSARCERMLLYCSLPLTFISQKEGEGEIAFFRAANQFFSEAMYELEDQYPKLAKKVINEIQNHEVNLIENFEHWCQIMFLTFDPDAFECLLQLYGSIRGGDNIDKIFTYFSMFIDACDDAHLFPKIKKTIAQIVFLLTWDSDLEDFPLGLDYWLLIGSCLFSNSFDIFNDIKPYVFDVDAKKVVSESKLIGRRRYSNDAADYVRERGRESRTVKKWITALQRLKRASADTRNEARDSARGSNKWTPISLRDKKDKRWGGITPTQSNQRDERVPRKAVTDVPSPTPSYVEDSHHNRNRPHRRLAEPQVEDLQPKSRSKRKQKANEKFRSDLPRKKRSR